ncbi:hypothetical protein SAMN05421869_120177 [Nonomuraea jiangxiensis]|uniref:Uncharacterized protein n=1 Tax=Nonomuraea jiangxiensis TaxID=633440 RepID=A0A1G9G575_9ACTN|nr:hypothetical protein SAMN05421869_120177 [Nonomuraea jiangxiensis]
MTKHGRTAPSVPLMIVAWAWVALPFAYGVYELLLKLTQLFGG